jgi:hypothetical protein
MKPLKSFTVKGLKVESRKSKVEKTQREVGTLQVGSVCTRNSATQRIDKVTTSKASI